ncbi:MAG: hypothetical protein LUQ54_03630, partial [Methanoregula sp.]|nr:hypothetical protein [Methanoregula sp.]
NDIILTVNRVNNQPEADKIRLMLGGSPCFSRLFILPFDPEIIQLEPSVNLLFSHPAMIINEIRKLAAAVTDPHNLEAS